jgi:CheY-like chemotaxis protein
VHSRSSVNLFAAAHLGRPPMRSATPRSAVWVVEDEPAAAELAADLCQGCGVEPSVFRSALPFLRAFREVDPPSAVVLDWRLEHELSAALFMATRHRFPQLPVVYWTGSEATSLPAMIRDDPLTIIVDKAGGASAFEDGLHWALAQQVSERRADASGQEANR